jgi:hypothetical protein
VDVKADGAVRTFGKYLAVWTFVLAALLFVGAATAPMFDGRPFGMHGRMMGDRMHGMMEQPDRRGMHMNMSKPEQPTNGDQNSQVDPTPPK